VKTKSVQKLYYSIREISDLIDEEQHVLRYWEREFDLIRPKKNRAGNRIYMQRDLAVVRVVKRLLREERLTIQEAKEALAAIDFDEIVAQMPEQGLPDLELPEQEESGLLPESDAEHIPEEIPAEIQSFVQLSRKDAQEMVHMLRELVHMLRPA
jgi:DNA-binding transcriptional MerR regulator